MLTFSQEVSKGHLEIARALVESVRATDKVTADFMDLVLGEKQYNLEVRFLKFTSFVSNAAGKILLLLSGTNKPAVILQHLNEQQENEKASTM